MIYLDNNATTPLDPDVLEAMRAASEAFGNPGSRHLAGRAARVVLEEARESIASILDAEPDEVIFTSGGTESSNLALFGAAAGRQGVILLPPGEHPATEEPVRRLIRAGCQRRELPLDHQGRLLPGAVDHLDNDVILATALLAHNETGVVQDLDPLAQACAQRGIPLHVDAVQAVGKIDVSFRRLAAATMSVASHKFHGPRGVGALLVRRHVRLRPLLLGGHQERSLRPGTEPVMLAAGMAHALRNWYHERQTRTEHLSLLCDRLQNLLLEKCSPCIVNGDPVHRLPNTLHVTFPGCDGDALLVALDLAGVCCSLGSACASGSAEPAPVLLAMGISPADARSSLRFSLGKQNTLEEVESAASILTEIVRTLRTRRSQ